MEASRRTQALVEKLRDAPNLILFGRSSGAGVAAEMALQFACRGLTLERPFTSIRDMANTVFPILPMGPLSQTRFDVLAKIAKVDVRLLVPHSDRDGLAPYEQAEKIFAATRAPKQFYTIQGAAHNDTYLVGADAYFARLCSFVETMLPTKPENDEIYPP